LIPVNGRRDDGRKIVERKGDGDEQGNITNDGIRKGRGNGGQHFSK
jgi:hypothetical protein